jgi:outer membrane protein assembly factor BamB
VRSALIILLSLTTIAAEWPQWRGKNRDGISGETGLLASWPSGGPPVLWKTTGLGQGFSSLAIAGGRVYTQGQRGERQHVVAFDAGSGKKLWETPTGAAFFESAGNGPRGTPTIDGDRLYAVAADGTLVCLNTATGKLVWSQNLVQSYGGAALKWGFSESPLIDGDRVVVMPGGPGASVVSLNKFNGALQWKTGSEKASYASVIVADIGGVRQLVALTGDALLGIKEDSGEILWRYTKVSSVAVSIATPIYHDGHVFISAAYDAGCALLKLGPPTVTEVYFNRNMRNHFSTSVLVGDVVYGFSENILTALEFKTGKVAWKHRSVGKGPVIYADRHLYLLGEDGVMALAEATPQEYKEVSRFEITIDPRPKWCPFWSLPAISDGKLYLRVQDHLICYNIKAR